MKAIINLINEDDECFKWAITRALDPVEKHSESIYIDHKLRETSMVLIWEGLKFPVNLSDINKFENLIIQFLLMYSVSKICFILLE